jgi:hypothetical protein
VRLGKGAVEFERLAAHRKDALDSDIHVIVLQQAGVAVGDARVGTSIERVQLNGLAEHPSCHFQVGFRVPLPELSAA